MPEESKHLIPNASLLYYNKINPKTALDLESCHFSGLSYAREVKASHSKCKVVVLLSSQKQPWILRLVIFQGCHMPERSTPPPFWIHFPTKELQLPLRQACFLQSIKRKHILDIQNYSKGTLSFQFLRLLAPVWYDIGASPNWIYGCSHYANGLRPHETCNAAITIYPNGPQGRLVSHLEISKKSWRSTKFWCFLFWAKRKFLWTFLCNF